MTLTYDDALAFVLRAEGGYVNNPADPGGATNYGITQATYDDYREDEDKPAQSVRLITKDEVARIYHTRYWRLCGAPALVAAAKHRLAFVTFDWAVNAGVSRSQVYVQAVVGTTPDGMWGERTLDAIALCDDAAATSAYLALRADHYRARVGQDAARDRLTANRLPPKYVPKVHPPSGQFLKGWLARLRNAARATGVPIGPTFAKGSESLSL